MKKIKVLQINTNRSYPAYDLALATAKEVKAEIIVLNEPNRKAIRNSGDWIFDEELDTAIRVTDSGIAIIEQGKGKGFSYVATSSFTIYGCYASPNKRVEEFEETLQQIGNQIRARGDGSIVAGDFNAKSPQWGMKTTDRRGKVLTEWIAQHGLIVKNVGTKPTFQRQSYGSILDLTLVSEQIGNMVSKWEVSDKETLSDHNYVLFEVNGAIGYMKKQRRLGWNTRKMDKRKLLSVVQEIEESPYNVTTEGFTNTLHKVCNQCMPKARDSRRNQPMYWWNDEIANLRRICLRKRRLVTRIARKNAPALKEALQKELDKSRKTLRKSIKASKRKNWDKVCDDVETDVWGKGYTIVMKRLIGQPPKPQLTMLAMEEVVQHLFPVHEEVIFNRTEEAGFTSFTVQELKLAVSKIKNNKAPGPGNVPPEIVKQIAISRPEYVLQVYNRLAATGNFPKAWKRSKLVLLKKTNKHTESPSSYRPLCLLDVEGKLYEQLILIRLKKELDRTGGLAENQFGFREGRQTVDAIKKVVMCADHAASKSTNCRRLCAVITIDVKNAFNSASWQNILNDLRSRKINEGLLNIIASYLSHREIIMEAEGKLKVKKINSGVPQGSVLGPTLWNIQYDGLLKLKLPEGVELVGFADDIAIVVEAANCEILMSRANMTILKVVQWLENRKLKLAPEKTEAVLLCTKRKVGNIRFKIQNITIQPRRTLKQLGVWLDTKRNFSTHINKAVEKAEKTMANLARLMPNIRGPSASKRRILTSVVHSQLLYAAPIWCKILQKQNQRRKVDRLQRILGIRVCSGYRTISTEAVRVITSIAPADLLAEERNAIYEGQSRNEAREILMTKWQERWTTAASGRWTWNLIPDIRKWKERPYGDVDYFLTQALSGHGCFRKYLFDRKRSETDRCPYCGEQDDVEHTLFSCARWKESRHKYQRTTGKIFTKESMMESLIESEAGWQLAYSVIRYIIANKEKEGRNVHFII